MTVAFTVRMPDQERYETVRTILAYESVVRGRTLGQTFAELVVEAADLDSYPEEVRARLREIADTSASKSVERILREHDANRR